MKSSANQPALDDVLHAFAAEPEHDRSTLDRYLREYPAYVAELLDLSRELFRSVVGTDEPCSTEEEVLIQRAWERHAAAKPKGLAEKFAAFSVAELRAIAERLDVKRQVLTAFRERRVQLASVPRRFLAQFAVALGSSMEKLDAYLSLPPEQNLARSYKADAKPSADAPVTFEQLLIEAKIPAEKRAILMAEDQ